MVKAFSAWALLMLMAGVLLIVGCRSAAPTIVESPAAATATPEFDRQAYEKIPADQGMVFWIDSQASEVRFYIWRGGPLASKGHNHVMRVKEFQGAVFLPNDMLQHHMQFDIVFPASAIEVDPLQLRRELGGAYAAELTPEGIQGTREHMLGEKVLDAAHYPTIGLSATDTYGEFPKMVLDTQITLHGVRRHRLVPVTIRSTAGQLHASGAFAIRQSDFGIVPFSALGGALYILDPIMIEFDIVAHHR